ncbi:MAG: metallophosphoesterase [Ignisphaera sp.]|uniref:Phosphoesterase n=1 Tax=Ignisphaera aggregans TaxID=334771 RepID=A0A832CZZ5_9CREN
MKKLTLIISDSHIPERAEEIDKYIIDFVKSKLYDIVVHAGDLVGVEVLDTIKSFGSIHYVVQGNMDYLDLPEKEIFEVYGIRIGVIHGDQVRPRGNINALSAIAKNMGVQILISGHTHSPFILFDSSGILHVNPGSITGVWSGSGGSMIPSFIEMEIYENKLVYLKLFELALDKIVLKKEEKFKFV